MLTTADFPVPRSATKTGGQATSDGLSLSHPLSAGRDEGVGVDDAFRAAAGKVELHKDDPSCPGLDAPGRRPT